MTDRRALLRQLPAIDRLLQAAPLRDLAGTHAHVQLRAAAQRAVEELRRQLLDESAPLPDLSVAVAARLAADHLRALETPSLRRVLNLTGTVLHTNFGRAPLAETALTAVQEVARGYSTLEYDLAAGQRGERHVHIEELFCRLTGAEAALAVNNNAGAVLLALSALAGGRSALVSRGELIEIGGSFRIPEIMAAGGVRLVEVGATNKTHLDDYRRAITPDTALILKVHTSNYRILGFTAAVPGEELAALGRERGIPVLEDLGSGLLLDLTRFGLPREPTVGETLASGIDLVTCSGDKLLGGPQAGLIAGKKNCIARLKKHPLARALRLDKMTLAALEATLRLYRQPENAVELIPTLNMILMPVTRIEEKASRLFYLLENLKKTELSIHIMDLTSRAGGGSLPMLKIPSKGIGVNVKTMTVNAVERFMRNHTPPIIGRIEDNLFIMDLRTVQVDEITSIESAFKTMLNKE